MLSATTVNKVEEAGEPPKALIYKKCGGRPVIWFQTKVYAQMDVPEGIAEFKSAARPFPRGLNSRKNERRFS